MSVKALLKLLCETSHLLSPFSNLVLTHIHSFWGKSHWVLPKRCESSKPSHSSGPCVRIPDENADFWGPAPEALSQNLYQCPGICVLTGGPRDFATHSSERTTVLQEGKQGLSWTRKKHKGELSKGCYGRTAQQSQGGRSGKGLGLHLAKPQFH